ncbi:P-loop containing nucleoside triphosphate hydrolase protein [Entophlyctis helioformis]|nr:P-loop containing nucleoside triphosphate hydrolase protein [Entophlyctis helioformis]
MPPKAAAKGAAASAAASAATGKGAKGSPSSSPKPAAASKSNGSNSSNSNSKGKKGDAPNADGPPLLTAKQAMYGVSWTGKTPLNLLHEHCQKQGWQKPEFHPRKSPKNKDRWTCSVTLSKFDKKLGQARKVSWTMPDDFETDQEAKHSAATFALHRVHSQTSAYRLLPPPQRDLWLKYEAVRKELPPEALTTDYAPDPFLVQEVKERNQEKAARERERAANDRSKNELVGPWLNYPTIGISSTDVQAIEHLIRLQFGDLSSTPLGDQPDEGDSQDAADTNQDLSHDGSSSKPANPSRAAEKPSRSAKSQELVQSFVRRGFREVHVREALTYTSDPVTVMEWLCAHVPDDDFPEQLGQRVAATVGFARHTTTSLGREYSLQRLSAWGFPRKACEESLAESQGRETLALSLLCRKLLATQDSANQIVALDAPDADELKGVFDEELEVLQSIFDERVEVVQLSDGVSVTVTLDAGSVGGRAMSLVVCISHGSTYPYELPGVVVKATLPAYIRMSLVQRLLQDAVGMLGAPMIFALLSLLEESAANIIDSPPPLSQLAIFNNLGMPSAATPSSDQLASDASFAAGNRPANVAKESADRTQQSNSKAVDKGTSRRDGRGSSAKMARKPRTVSTPSNEQYLEKEERKKQDPAYSQMLRVRQKLPSAKFRDSICKELEQSRALVLCGETGCGKSTQVGQFILEDYIAKLRGSECNIICTQPRKISAISLARRVSEERCEALGDAVGYAVRGDSVRSDATRLMFCTTGILLRMLLGEPMLPEISHVIVDEVHERTVESDFLLILLRDLLKKRTDLRVVLMSATINSDTFSSYFSCGVITIPGFTHPVKDIYLEHILGLVNYAPEMPRRKQDKRPSDKDSDQSDEDAFASFWNGQPDIDIVLKQSLASAERSGSLRLDYNLISAVVAHICETYDEGSILIFLPGALEIKRCIETLKASPSSGRLRILPLHANLSNEEQSRVFKPVRAPERKVIVATNIAETSITIDDVVFVIDSGKVKEIMMHEGVVTIAETWCSRAASKQRRGRAGRVKPGVCFKLFSSMFDRLVMPAHSDPEILRTPLEQLCLQIRAMGVGDVASFLGKALSPPAVENVTLAMGNLRDVSALDQHGQITSLGRHMAAIPADLRLAKMLLFGATFKCFGPVLTVAACLTEKSPFLTPFEPEQQAEAKQARMKFATEESDLLTACNAFAQWQQTPSSQRRQFCQNNYLSHVNLLNIADRRIQFAESLAELGYIAAGRNVAEGQEMNVHSADTHMLKSIIVAGLYPNIAWIKLPEKQYEQMAHGTIAVDARAQDIHYLTKDSGRCRKYQFSHLVFDRKLATNKVYIMNPTPAPPMAIILFGGELSVLHNGHAIAVGGSARFRSFPRIAALVNGLRRMIDLVLKQKFEDPGVDVLETDVGKCLAKVLGSA